MNFFQALSPQQKIYFYLKISVFIFLSFWLFFWLAEKINLTNSDIGRHLQNGKIILTDATHRNALLKTNFYSYTEPDFPFLNHHWLSGVVFFLVYKISGFVGLSLFYLFFVWLAFGLAFYLAQKYSGFIIASFLAIFLIPLIANRTEIRPEVFSYFLSVLYFFLLWQFSQEKITLRKMLIIFSPIQFLWVNIHIGFASGFMILTAFGIDFFIQGFLTRKWLIFKQHLILFFSVSLISFLNPAGYKGLFYPLKIFQNFGYRLAENQSVLFLENFGMINSNFFILKITTLSLAITFIWVFLIICRKTFLFLSPFCKVGYRGIFYNYKDKYYSEQSKLKLENFSSKTSQYKNTPNVIPSVVEGSNGIIANLIISIFLCFMAWTASRNLSHFGFFALISLGINIGIIKNSLKYKIPKIDYSLIALGAFCLIGFIFVLNAKTLSGHFSKFGLGLKKNNLASLDFFKKNSLSGPIFNNYDIGGFLIYGLYPENKVFTDNRPEAYPEKHFGEIYTPMQEKKEVFQQQDAIYNFNTIFFYRHDYTTWGQQFLVEKIGDSNWAPVFVDDDVIIFVKNNDRNKKIIQQFRLPNEIFKVTEN